MRLLEHKLYREDVRYVGELPLPWNLLQDSSVMLSGATGMVGSFLTDVLMYRNLEYGQNCTIYALGRSEEKAAKRFQEYWDAPLFHFLQWDILNEPKLVLQASVDYLLHLASTTHPKAYATEPISTIMLNVAGLNSLLSFAHLHGARRFVFTSSCEVYGECPDGLAAFSEDSCGYIDCNSLRAGYPESKRAGEALCQAYIWQEGMDIVIPRLSRVFGPTMLASDTKAVSQFIKKGVLREDVVLKSRGTQVYSYSYVADAVSGLLTCLFQGECGGAYNIASQGCEIALRDLAAIAAECGGRAVVFELPDQVEAAGYSKASRSVLNSRKLQELGWHTRYGIREGVERTIQMISDVEHRST